MAQIIDGRKIAQRLKDRLQLNIQALRQAHLRSPCLAVILVGHDPASQIYVGHKEKACKVIGIRSQTFRLPADCREEEVLRLISRLNEDEEVDGILVQLPLPSGVDRFKVVSHISPYKDVDGLGPQNQGLLALNLPGFVPCTPLGVMEMLKAISFEPQGKHAVVIGRSLLVGAPMVRLLTQHDATVTNVHSRSVHPARLCKQADLLVVAAGVRHLVDETWVKEGAVVIDVGMHRHGDRLEGDVNSAKVEKVASYLSPVPGGVGPMTIACLLANCVKAYEWKRSGYSRFAVS